jgi:Spy/CpxP family protein refolding chaperone
MNRKSGVWIAVWAILVLVTGFLAFGSGFGLRGYGPWHSWGRMGGWDADIPAGSAYGGYGMGPGMMGSMSAGRSWGMPYGMMGRYGAGMVGMGPGMLNRSMMGSGYALAPVQPPDFTPEQAQKFDALQREAEERNSRQAQQLWAAQDKLNRLQMSDKPDWSAIRSASQTLMDLQRQQLEASIDFQQKVDSLLTDSQRQDMARSWRDYGWMRAQ